MLTQTAADQFPHHPGGPQGKGQFELFGAFVRDPGPHAPCLGLGQPAFAPAMGVQATVKQRLFTVTGVVAQPLIDGLTPDANRLRGFSPGLVQAQDQENRTDPKGLLRGAAEATKVFLFHAAKYNGFNSKCQVLCWEIRSNEAGESRWSEGRDGLRKTGPRQLGLALADSPSGGGMTEPPDASGRRSFLLHKA